MFSKFLNLGPEKKERILNAAMKEFAKKGYKNASTNEIVKEAKISKGLLFHYFNSKKDLFLFLYDYAVDVFVNEFYKKIDLNERDILKRFRQIALVKIELKKKYPEIHNFIKIAGDEDSVEVRRYIERRKVEISASSYDKLLADIDFSRFKEGIDVKRAIDVIIWTMEGFAARKREILKSLSASQADYDLLLAEMDAYIRLLGDCFYKKWR
jgi:AcrR family transcriptional regulator